MGFFDFFLPKKTNADGHRKAQDKKRFTSSDSPIIIHPSNMDVAPYDSGSFQSDCTPGFDGGCFSDGGGAGGCGD